MTYNIFQPKAGIISDAKTAAKIAPICPPIITDDDTSGKYDNQGSLAGENFSKTVESYVQIDGGGGNSATNIPVAGVKTWRDNDNAVGMRPESIMLELYQNDVKIATQKVTASTD